ncbi:MAG: LysR family transcriptional regulator [Brotaphodocola sp.]
MEIRQFTYVKMVADCGNFTKAAAKLFITQPALSNYISKVEEELGVKLFDRSATPLTLTYAGEQYLNRARIIIDQIENMNREMRDITHHLTGKLKLGFPSERIIYMFPLMLKPFKDRYPGIDVEVVTGPGNSLVENLRRGEVDFLFLPTWHSYKDITQEQVSEEELVLVAKKGYLSDEYFLDREKKIIDWKKAAKLPLLTLKKGHALRGSVDVLYKNAGLKPNILLESHSNMLSYRLASQGLGVAIIPEITLDILGDRLEAEVCHLSEIPVTWGVYAFYRKDAYIGEVEWAFLDIAKEALNSRRNRF